MTKRPEWKKLIVSILIPLAVGGAAALIAKSIKSEELLCYEDLGTEAVRRYTVEDFPCIVAIDSEGNNVYETEPVKYRVF